MKNKILPKTAALLIFFCGITAFVYHQSGYPSKSSMKFNGSPNGGKVSYQTDSLTQAEKDSVDAIIMSSSKTYVPKKLPFKRIEQDSVKQDSVKQNEKLKKERLMLGSKTAIITKQENATDTVKQIQFKKTKP